MWATMAGRRGEGRFEKVHFKHGTVPGAPEPGGTGEGRPSTNRKMSKVY